MSSNGNKTTLAGVLVLPALVLALVGCAGSQPSQMQPSTGATDQPAESGSPTEEETTEGDGDVIMTVGLAFMPETITVEAGTTVTWQNGEAISHTVTSGAWGDVNEETGLRGTETADGLFDHDLARMGEEGDSFSFTFEEPGEYPYFCKPHLTMNAMVIVE